MPLVRTTAFRAACLAVLAFGSTYAAPARAQTKPNIVVMGEDADEDAVPRGNRIFQRVIHELSETMNLRGYNVYDETAVAMGFTQANRVRRRDDELIEVARAVQNPPLDVVAVFQIYASASKSAYSDIVRPEIRIPGRLLNVRTGQSLGSFEVAEILELFTTEIAPHYYNRAIFDVQTHLKERFESIESDLWALEKP